MFFKTEDPSDSKLISQLYALGRQQQYLTYAQIDGFFPNISSSKPMEEQFENLKSLLNAMSIQIFEVQPTPEQLKLSLLDSDIIPEDEDTLMALLGEIDRMTCK